MNSKSRAFSLMELLIVIAIIVMVLLVSWRFYTRASAKNRDAIRVSDIEQIQRALTTYALDNNNQYPDSNTATNGWRCLGDDTYCWNNAYNNDSDVNTALLTYMDEIPDDPLDNVACNGDAYIYSSDANPYSYGYGTYLQWYSETGSCGLGSTPASDSCGTRCYLKLTETRY